jgi:hypothetical protein
MPGGQSSRQFGIDAKAFDKPRQARRIDPVGSESKGRVAQGQDHERGERDHGHQRFKQHSPIPHQTAVGFHVDLFGRGSRPHQSMEPRTGPAGHRHEKHGKQRHSVQRFGSEKGRVLNFVPAQKKPDDPRQQGAVKKVSAQVPARLNQQPERNEGRNEAIPQNNKVPSELRANPSGDREMKAETSGPKRWPRPPTARRSRSPATKGRGLWSGRRPGQAN